MSDAILEENQTLAPVYLAHYQVPPFLIDEVFLHFDLNDACTLVKSKLSVRKNEHSSHVTNTLKLHGQDLSLEMVKINGELLAKSQYEVTPEFLIIPNVKENFSLEIVTKIYPQKNTALSGLYRSKNTYCTQCEAEGFRRITFFLDQPDVLARYTTTIIADRNRFPVLLSNGNLIQSTKLENGRHSVTWQDPFKKPSYLFALVAGDFDLLEDKFVTSSKREVSLRIYVEKGLKNEAHHAMYALKEAMRWDEVTYGREYDLTIYMIVAINDFNMGAMENKGLNIFNTKYILANPATATDDDYIHILSVVGHEYFHNWSGNRVTCRDWFQLSLKEGLTIFRDQSFTEDVLSRPLMRIRDVNYLREAQFPEDDGPLKHPVRPNSYIEINNFYTATVYNKGAEVLRMLQTILGAPTFRKAMDAYFSRFDGQAVTIEDFIETMEDISGINLGQFRLWYVQSGTPIVEVKSEYDAEKKTYTLTVNQTLKDNKSFKPFLIPITTTLLNQKGEEIPLKIKDEMIANEHVLLLHQPSEDFVFNEVGSKPIPSLFRHFSAPIKLRYDYSDEELLFLFNQDTDIFNRWEAGQHYKLRLILNKIDALKHKHVFDLPQNFYDAYQRLLENPANDLLMLAEMLQLPSEKYIGEQMNIIDVDHIHAAKENLCTHLAERLCHQWQKVYEMHHHHQLYSFNLVEVGKRQLKNTALFFLAKVPENLSLCLKQFDQALGLNMTDTIAPLKFILDHLVPEREYLLTAFYDKFKEDALVLDKWFALQASAKLPHTLKTVMTLMSHPKFDLKNPNKVYALIGTFTHQNAINFHAKDGSGYQFLGDVVLELNKLNPQIAARMVKPLTTFKRYDKERQGLMQAQLERLMQSSHLSKDVYELVAKSLVVKSLE